MRPMQGDGGSSSLIPHFMGIMNYPNKGGQGSQGAHRARDLENGISPLPTRPLRRLPVRRPRPGDDKRGDERGRGRGRGRGLGLRPGAGAPVFE